MIGHRVIIKKATKKIFAKTPNILMAMMSNKTDAEDGFTKGTEEGKWLVPRNCHQRCTESWGRRTRDKLEKTTNPERIPRQCKSIMLFCMPGRGTTV